MSVRVGTAHRPAPNRRERRSVKAVSAATPKTVAPHEECRYLTVPLVGRRVGVGAHKVLTWIRTGKLRAINTSDGSERPRYRVHEADLQVFLDSLVVSSAPRQTVRRQRPAEADVIEFFR